LEGVEGYANGKEKVVIGEVCMKELVAILNEEIGVFEVK
jgi:hypothetical protein